MACPCAGCGKTVFPAEKQVLNGKAFHKGQGCAKCALCGNNLTIKNFISVSGDDKNLWLCNAHGVATTNQAAAFMVKNNVRTEPFKPTYQTGDGLNSNKQPVNAKDRFAAFIKRSVEEGQSRKLREFGSLARASTRKKATKDALTDLSKRQEIAAFVEDLRRQEATAGGEDDWGTMTMMESENPMFSSPLKKPVSSSTLTSTISSGSTYNNATMKSSVPSDTGKFSRFVKSIRLTKPSATSPVSQYQPAPQSSFTPSKYNNSNFGTGGGRKGLVSMSLKNIRVRDRANMFQKAS